jgi:hypothetical protein
MTVKYDLLFSVQFQHRHLQVTAVVDSGELVSPYICILEEGKSVETKGMGFRIVDYTNGEYGGRRSIKVTMEAIPSKVLLINLNKKTQMYTARSAIDDTNSLVTFQKVEYLSPSFQSCFFPVFRVVGQSDKKQVSVNVPICW